MVIHPTSSELSFIADRLGMNAREAKIHRKMLLAMWKTAIYSAVRVGYPEAIRHEIIQVRADRAPRQSPVIP